MKPRFVDDMKNITVEVGQDATFTCTVSEIHVGRDSSSRLPGVTGDTVQGYRVGWVNANSKAIQAIGTHVITHNDRVSGSEEASTRIYSTDLITYQQSSAVSHDEARRKWMLHIAKAQLEDSGPYMCQVLYYTMYCTVLYCTVLFYM